MMIMTMSWIDCRGWKSEGVGSRRKKKKKKMGRGGGETRVFESGRWGAERDLD